MEILRMENMLMPFAIYSRSKWHTPNWSWIKSNEGWTVYVMAPEWVFEGMKATREEIGIKDYVKSLVLHMGKLHKLKERKVQMKSYSQIVAMETWMIMMCTVRKTDDISIRSWNNITLGILLYLLFDTTI